MKLTPFDFAQGDRSHAERSDAVSLSNCRSMSP